jgi:hypothetical protein
MKFYRRILYLRTYKKAVPEMGHRYIRQQRAYNFMYTPAKLIIK